MTEQEKNALDIVLGKVQEVKLDDDTSVAFNGNEYVLIDGDGQVYLKFDEFDELVEYIERNDWM
jgi:hypothetical protein